MSSSLESNKIFAAILIAGITAMFGGFIAREFVHPHELEKDAVAVEGSAAEGGAAVAAGPEPILNLIATADVAKGEKLSKACAACHNFGKGEGPKVGPELWDTLGHKKGGHAGFDYSEGMQKKGGTWTYADLNKFLYKPKAFVEGTKMGFIGLKKAEDRASVIAWLRTLEDSPPPLPSKAEIDAEAKELAPPAAAPAAADAAKPADGKPGDAKAGDKPAEAKSTEPAKH